MPDVALFCLAFALVVVAGVWAVLRYVGEDA